MAHQPVSTNAFGAIECLPDVAEPNTAPATGSPTGSDKPGLPSDPSAMADQSLEETGESVAAGEGEAVWRGADSRLLDLDTTTPKVRIEGMSPALQESDVFSDFEGYCETEKGMVTGAQGEPSSYKQGSSIVFFGGLPVAFTTAMVAFNGQATANAPSGVHAEASQQKVFVSP